MPEIINREVRFDTYCDTCKHKDTKEIDNPCNECLEWPMNNGTEKPYNWEAKE